MRRSDFVVLCTFLVLGIDATCYFPNGTAQDAGDQFPCNTASGVESMCCNTQNTTTPGRCTKDGLCIPYDNRVLWRGTCTDPTWKDPACLHMCTVGQDSNGTNYADLVVALITCADGTWCCGFQDDWDKCCAGGKGVTIVDGKVVTPQAIAPTSSSVPKPSASAAQTLSLSPSSSPAAAATTTSSPKSASSNTGSIVGGAVGGCAGVIALAFVFWYFIMRRKMNQRSLAPNYESYQVSKEGLWQAPKEAPTQEIRGELDSTQERQELDVRRR